VAERVIDLDDPDALAGADPSGMLSAVLGLPEDCERGYDIGRSVQQVPTGEGLSALAVCGMGGSGVVGDVVQALYRDRVGIPVAVVKGPQLPEFCGKDTLVVCSSYSGNTAEVLACFEEAARRGCRTVAVTSGGELALRAGREHVPLVSLPSGFLMPRTAIGVLVFGMLGALERVGVIPQEEQEVEDTVAALRSLASAVGPDRPATSNRAKLLAARVAGRFPVVWGADGIGAVAAARWRSEFAENAKVPAFASALPELNHNEVVGWSEGMGERFFLVTLRHDGEHPDVAERFGVSVNVVSASGMDHEEVRAEGESPLARLMWLAMLGDATTVYLAFLRGVDPTPIEAISRIKAALEGRPAP
jgi:glucose/mannose-6-phosphate isomerase